MLEISYSLPATIFPCSFLWPPSTNPKCWSIPDAITTNIRVKRITKYRAIKGSTLQGGGACNITREVDCVWNVMSHAQKTDFVFRRNGRGHLNGRGASVQSTTGSRGVRISGSNGYTMFRGSVKSTGYPLHSPISPSLPLPCVTMCYHISTGLYNIVAEHFRY
jgi:hypothetical protein